MGLTMAESRPAPARTQVMLGSGDERRLVQDFFAGRTGFFVDVGANDPHIDSQTFHLEQSGWTGVLIEPQPDLAEALRIRRAKVYANACSGPENAGTSMRLHLAGVFSSLNKQLPVATARVEQTIAVSVRTLDDILRDARAPAPIDFLSIDVEGHELEVLRGFDFDAWRPRLILIEDHVLDRSLHSFLVRHGYVWIRRTGLNSWYVPALSACRPGVAGRLQFFRKYYLAVPFRRLREIGRRIRVRLDLAPEAQSLHHRALSDRRHDR
jgi:FkbM family methyltransferase